MTRRHLIRTGAVGLACTAIGAGAGILGSASGASTSTPPSRSTAGAKTGAGGGHLLRRALHADIVVAGANGTFDMLTFDRGVLESLSGAQLTLREGTKKASYHSVTLTIPATATVRLDGAATQLAQLKSGDHVRVLAGPTHTLVAATDKARPASATAPAEATG